MKKGSLIVISGFSGAGKGTIVKRLLEKHDSYALSVSMTTRNPRPGEEEGKSYFFRSEEEFEKTFAVFWNMPDIAIIIMVRRLPMWRIAFKTVRT